jgi:O-antigen/teichoic acid export membrane protein
MGLPRLVTREVAAAKARGDMAVLFGVLRWADRTAWRISGLMAVGVLVAGFVIARQNTSVLVVAILCGVPMIPLLALARIRGGALQGLHYIVLGQIPDTLLRPILLSSLILIVSLTSLPFGPAYAMALNSFTAAVVFLVAFVVLRKRLPEGRPAKVAKAGRRWLASSIPMALTDGMRILQSELSVLLLGFLAVPVTDRTSSGPSPAPVT